VTIVLGYLGLVALGLIPVYLTIRVWQHVRHAKILENAVRHRTEK
jgi:hypothetical protein